MADLRRLRARTKGSRDRTEEKKESKKEKAENNKGRFQGVSPVPKSVVLEADDAINNMLENMEFFGRKANFIKEFCIDFKPEKAAKRAGYRDVKYGYKMIKEEGVINAVKSILDAHEANKLITPEFLQGQMGIYARSNIADYFDAMGNFKGFDNITRAQSSCINSFHKKYDKNGNPEYKITLYDAMKANENLGKVHQLYADPKEDPNEFNDMTQDELLNWLSENLPPEIADKLAGGNES